MKAKQLGASAHKFKTWGEKGMVLFYDPRFDQTGST